MASQDGQVRFYEQLFESVSDAIFVYDPENGVVVTANPAAAEITGYPVETLEGRSVAQFSAGTPAEVEQAALRIIETASAGAQEFEWPIERADGELRTTEVSLQRTTLGGDDRALAIMRDVTEREQARNEANEQRQVLSLLTEVNPAVLWLFSPDWDECLFINDAYEELFGRSTTAIKSNSMDFMEAVHPEDRETVQTAMEQLSNGSRVELEYRVNESEAYSRWVWTEGLPIFNETGELQSVVGFNRDITDMKRLETELIGQRDELAALTDNAPIILFELDDEGTFLQSRGRGLDDLQIDPNQFIGESIFEVYGDYEVITDACRQALNGEAVRRTVDFEGFVFDAWYQPTYDETGAVDGVLGVAVTVTDRARLEADLMANNRALQDLHTRAARSDLTLSERIETMLDIGRERLDLPYGFLTRIDDGTQHIVESVGSHDELQAGASAPLSQAYCRRTIDTEGLLGVQDAVADGWEGDPAYERFNLNCYIGGKLQVDGELYGTVCFADSVARDRSFSEFERSLVELLVQWLGYELQRDQRESRLRELNDELETVLDTSPVAIVQLDEEATILQWNQCAAELFNIPAAGAVGSHIHTIPKEQRPEFQTLLGRVMDGEVIRDYETTQRGADGSQRVLSLNLESTVDDDGDPTGAIVAVTDITSRKRRHQRTDALRAATQDLVGADEQETVGKIALRTARDALEFPICAVWLYDETADVLSPVAQSEAAVELVGDAPTIDRGEGLFWRAFLTGQTVVVNDVQSEDGIFNPETDIGSEIIVPMGDHGVLAVASAGTQSFGTEDSNILETLAGSLTAALNSVADKERLRQRDRELQRQNEQLDEFADVIAHDLRGPLTAARGFFEIALETSDPDHFKRVEEAHARMELLIDDLLTMARQGRSIGDRMPVDLVALARRIWADVHDEATLKITEPLPDLTGDVARLEEVFSNLFRNAVDHVGPNVTVRVGPLDDGGFYVEDDGPGIPVEKRDHIFDYGYTTNLRGTGIGLAVVEEIIIAHGWTISVTDGSDGGARFEIST
ncbi:PAS domain S-box protein [Halorubrum sp. PV6]|uniref:PAS domain S-box protein n=1 Tax=Halorubrum sp. PV6 TaxID=634157 RepID=UPI000F8570D6|nr:PAS domain S-box protein [Halorubrum sp. PV6]AZQ15112.1 hypothetical protein DOS48_09900 [Halorubrum sp. PV6]